MSWRGLAGGRQPHELPLHRIDLREVISDVMVAAPLVGGQPEAAPCIGLARPGAAQVNHCGQILLLLERGAPLASHRARDAAIQQGCCQLNGVARHDASVEAVEPARVRVVPGSILDHDMVVDAVLLRLAERPVSDLIHADCARRRLVQLERIPRQAPPPVRPCHRVAPALDLSKRGQKRGRDNNGRMLAEERLVSPPCLGRGFAEGAAYRKVELGRLADRLVHPVNSRPSYQNDDRTDEDPNRQRRGPHRPDRTPEPPAETPETSDFEQTHARSAGNDSGDAPVRPGGHEAIMPQQMPAAKRQPLETPQIK